MPRVTGGWHPATVVAVRRGNRIVVSDGYCCGLEREYPSHEVKPYPRNRGEWPR
jgi:hypothetical protein